ncbi:MAG: hypothetical protein ACD_62C00124G0015 [uncultured bacterium]|nr:MAG: hypothetical protein ACD_62C00124G0015 [uncultured bacterium]HLD44944.1 DUF1328 domain-containing protein [bacterium]
MLRWSISFFLVAVLAAVFGFTGIAADAVSIAKVLFVVFLVLFIVSLIVPRWRRNQGIN